MQSLCSTTSSRENYRVSAETQWRPASLSREGVAVATHLGNIFLFGVCSLRLRSCIEFVSLGLGELVFFLYVVTIIVYRWLQYKQAFMFAIWKNAPTAHSKSPRQVSKPEVSSPEKSPQTLDSENPSKAKDNNTNNDRKTP